MILVQRRDYLEGKNRLRVQPPTICSSCNIHHCICPLTATSFVQTVAEGGFRVVLDDIVLEDMVNKVIQQATHKLLLYRPVAAIGPLISVD